MHTKPPKAPEAITFERDYPGIISQAREVRADLAKVGDQYPDDLVLLASELATNAILGTGLGLR